MNKEELFKDKRNVPVAEYAAIHWWLKHNFGVASCCENKDCPKECLLYDWAKVTDKPYAKIRENFIQLCKKCHKAYDMTDETRKRMSRGSWNKPKTHCRRGHEYNEQNTYITTIGSRMCKQCSKINNRNWRERNKTKGIIQELKEIE